MFEKRVILSSGILLSSLLLNTQVQAKSWYPASQPAIYNNAIGCTTCHSGTPQTERNANTTYGLLFGNLSDDDNGGGLLSAYIALERYDIDRDGFSNGQELRQTSGYFNSSALTPTLTAPDINAGNVMAKAVTGSPVTALSVTGTSFLNDITTFEKPDIANAVTTTTFMYKFGGMQAGATATFYDENNTPMAANTADGSYSTNLIPADTTLDGSMNILVKDEGVFDLYSQAAFIRIAKARTPTFTPIAAPNALGANVSAFAKISPSANIDSYAVINAYAIVDNNATVGPYAQIGSYAYIAPNVSVNGTATLTKAIVDPYVNVKTSITTAGTTALPTSTGYVQAKFSITTTVPIIPSITGVGDENEGEGGEGGESSGGLHCMTTGLGLQALIFFGLFAAGFMVRRKRT